MNHHPIHRSTLRWLRCGSLILLLAAQSAWAIDYTCRGNSLQTIDLGTLAIDSDAPVGSVLRDWTPVQEKVAIVCGYNTMAPAHLNYGLYLKANTAKTGDYQGAAVFQSTVPGIGVALKVSAYINVGGPTTPPTEPLPMSDQEFKTQVVTRTAMWREDPQSTYRISVALVKTGDIASFGGVQILQNLTSYALTEPDRLSIPGTYPPNPDVKPFQIKATLKATTCTVKLASRNQTINMGTVALSAFTGLGSSTRERPFAIGLSCGGVADLAMTFDGIKDGDDLKLDPGGAQGIALQLLDPSHAPIVIGRALNLGKSHAGEMNFDFSARYRQNLPTVAAGQANAVTQFTLSYP